MPPEIERDLFHAMGGTVEVQAIAPAPGIELVRELFARSERSLSRFLEESELCALNRSAGRPFEASPLLLEILSAAVAWSRATGGLFDPTVIDDLESAGYDRTFDRIARSGPVATRPRPVVARSWRSMVLDFEHQTVTLRDGARVDLGGIGKGYTVDRAIAALGARPNAMVNASGDLYAAGDGPDGEGWYVGVQDPLDPGVDLAVLKLKNRAVATSGTARRHWTAGGVRYHHLIDPREGRPSTSDLVAVTVVAQNAAQADVLAKSAFLLGSGAATAFIERFDGAACLTVTAAGTMMVTPRMKEYIA